jgi:hypothetical protein
MHQSADQLKDYLAPEESLVAVSTGALYEQSSWHPMSIGITDRRLVYLADDGRYVTVGYDAIRTIRSRPVTTRNYRKIGSHVLLWCGALLTLLGIVSVIALATTVLVPLLALVTVGGVVAAEYHRRVTDEIDWGTVTEVTEHIPYDIDGTAVRQRYERFIPDVGNETQVLLLGSGAVAVLSFIGLVLLVPSEFVVPGVFVILSGLVLVDYTLRPEGVFDQPQIVQNKKTKVSISIQNDQSIYIRSYRSQEVEKKLSRAVFADGVEPSHTVPSPFSIATDSPEI